MPHPAARAAGRDTLMSCSPDRTNDSTSLRLAAGSMRTRPDSSASSTRAAYRDSRKNQLDSVTVSGTTPCSGHRPPDQFGLVVELLATRAVEAVVPSPVEVAASSALPP